MSKWKLCLTGDQRQHLNGMGVQTLTHFREIRRRQRLHDANPDVIKACWTCEDIEHRLKAAHGGPKLLAVLDATGEVVEAAIDLLDRLELEAGLQHLYATERDALRVAITRVYAAREQLKVEEEVSK